MAGMSLSSDALRKLAALRLDADQMAGVLEVLADMQAVEEERLAKQRDRVRRHRDKQACNVTETSPSRSDPVTSPTPPGMVPLSLSPDPLPNPPLNPPTPLVRPKRVRTQYRDDFEDFWSAYPTDPLMSKKDTAAAWDRLDPEDRAKARQAVRPFAEHCAKTPDYRPVHAVRFLTQRRFDGFVQLHAPPPGTPHFETQEEFDAWWANRKATA